MHHSQTFDFNDDSDTQFDSADTVIIRTRPRTRGRTWIWAAIMSASVAFGVMGLTIAVAYTRGYMAKLDPAPNAPVSAIAVHEARAAAPAVEETKPEAAVAPAAENAPAKEPLPDEVEALLSKHRFAAALDAVEKSEHAVVWREKVRVRWAESLASAAGRRSNDIEHQLDTISAYRSHWPKDPMVVRLEAQVLARHKASIDQLVGALERRGLVAELRPLDGKRREYAIRAKWKPTQEARLAALADPMRGGLSIVAEIVDDVGLATRETEIRAKEAVVQFVGTKDALRFPVECARRFSDGKGLALRERIEILGCAKMQHDG